MPAAIYSAHSLRSNALRLLLTSRIPVTPAYLIISGAGIMMLISAPLCDRNNDLYETPAVAVEALLRVEKLPHHIWECACGPGSIVKSLRAAGHTVWATDLV